MARIAWVDRAKGWGMVLIMAGHGDVPLRLALSFVPLPIFFFLSGYLYHEKKYTSLLPFLRAKTRTLLIPYLLFAILNCGMWLIFHPVVFSQGFANAVWPLVKQIVAVHRSGEDPYLGPYWFILCLFVTELIYFAITRAGDWLSANVTGNRLGWRMLLTGAVTTFGFIYVRNGSRWLPWSSDVALVAIAFFAVGHLAQLYSGFDALFEKKWLIAPATVGLLLGVMNIETSVWHRATMYSGYYHNPFLFLLGCYSGLYLFLLIMRRIREFKPVQVIGRESLAFLALHSPIFFPMAGFVDGIFSPARVALIFPHSPILHSLAARALKGSAGTAVTICGIVAAYLVIAPLTFMIRKHAAFLLDGKKLPEISTVPAVAFAGEGAQLADPMPDLLRADLQVPPLGATLQNTQVASRFGSHVRQ